MIGLIRDKITKNGVSSKCTRLTWKVRGMVWQVMRPLPMGSSKKAKLHHELVVNPVDSRTRKQKLTPIMV